MRSTDSSPSRPAAVSTPISAFSGTGQLLVSSGCHGHCDCVECMKCVYCAACESCTKCKKCQVCRYPPRRLGTGRGKNILSNDHIKRRIGAKAKSSNIKPLSLEEIVKPKMVKTNTVLADKNLETKYVGDNLTQKSKTEETKYVGDNLNGSKSETKSVGDKTKDDKTGPVLVSSTNHDKVSKLLNFNINVKVSDLSSKEKQALKFCERRITLNNRRLQVQKPFRESGIISQMGSFRLHDSSDVDFWVTISLVGFTYIMIPRCGLHLLGYINFCPLINWSVIGLDGHPISDLTKIGQILNEHVLFDNRVSVQPIRFAKLDDKKVEPPKQDKNPPTLLSAIPPPSPAVNASNGFPIGPPSLNEAPVFVWRAEDRNLGSPTSRRREFLVRRHGLPNLTVWNGITRLVHNGQPLDPVNEEREMLFIAT